jgi:hypothetical protein
VQVSPMSSVWGGVCYGDEQCATYLSQCDTDQGITGGQGKIYHQGYSLILVFQILMENVVLTGGCGCLLQLSSSSSSAAASPASSFPVAASTLSAVASWTPSAVAVGVGEAEDMSSHTE